MFFGFLAFEGIFLSINNMHLIGSWLGYTCGFSSELDSSALAQHPVVSDLRSGISPLSF